MKNVDWEEQWKMHAPGYENGFLKIALEQFGGPKKEAMLCAGAGFGDLSHPTTRLSLRLLIPRVKNQHVVDVGCGSGVLSVAALGAGAASVLGIDVCEEALDHARQNAKLNGYKMELKLPGEVKQLPKKGVFVMNMIRSEQEVAWRSLPANKQPSWLVTSGILKEEQAQATALYQSWGLDVVETLEEEGWMAFLVRVK